MDNPRIYLWIALALLVWMNIIQWDRDYGSLPTPRGAATAQPSVTPSSGPAPAETTLPALPSADPTAPPPASTDPAAVHSTVSNGATAAPKIRVVTDVLDVDVSLQGGDLLGADLVRYPVDKKPGSPAVRLLSTDEAKFGIVRSGLRAADGRAEPTHLVTYTSPRTEYRLAPGEQELRVPLTWTDGQGVTVMKTFVFKRGSFAVTLEYAVQNASPTPWTAASYARISRVDPAVERSMFKVESFAYRGPAIFDPNGDKYKRLDIEKTEFQNFSVPVTDGWLAAMQHHFVSAVVPNAGQPYTYTLRAQGRQFILGAMAPTVTVAPGATTTIKETLFFGPKLQKQLVELNPELDRVADYGVLAFLARPLFWLLDHAHSLVKNWGLAIILITLLLKLLFYPLAQYAGRQMARMRQLTPRMKQLQETYKDDREKLGRAMMDLYRTEKANPLSGCLPMLIQMPVFLAFYWVLLESVEMRQAPFFGWINDLSARDPFFILPALNGLAMWMQYKLNPPPPDPVQAKVFQFMPLVFSVMFALFPAGLVLYWVTNTGLSILQQWNINRTIEAEDRAKRK